MYWANNLSIAIGGSLGGFLFKDYLFELLIALSITALITVILIVFFIDESYVPEQVADQKVLAYMSNVTQLSGSFP